MPHPFDLLPLPSQQGGLLLTPCPGLRDSSVSQAMATLQLAGASGVISLMPMSELQHNAADSIGTTCGQLGLAWYHLPVADESAPLADFDSAWQAAAPDLLARLRAGEYLAIHCKGGSGRTGLIAARILIAFGVPHDEAVAQVQALRPNAIQHPVHRAWLAQFNPAAPHS